jgi:hypothetical protein
MGLARGALAGVLVLVSGGGCASRASTRLDRPIDPAIDRAIDRLVEAARNGDVVAIRGLLDGGLSYGGLWFGDAACRDRLPAPRAIPSEELDAVAGCLATLPLARSGRTSGSPGVAVLAYAPGIELEAAFAVAAGAVTMTWIGYAGRRGANDLLPTITGDALEALREDGRRPVATAKDAPMTWLKVCLDAAGDVEAVHPRWTTSSEALAAAVPIARQWRFRPFTLGGQPAAVCAMAALAHPGGDDVDGAVLPLSVPDGFSHAVMMSAEGVSRHRIEGETLIVPSDRDRDAVLRTPGRRVASSFQLCIDERGEVAAVTMMQSTGLPSYDAHIAASLASWRYAPIDLAGSPVAVCTVVGVVYEIGGVR